MHHTKDKGDLAVAKTIAKLEAHDIFVCLPISEHLPFDFVAVMPDMTTLRRVQVKYRSDLGVGAILIHFSSNYYDSKRIYSKPINLNDLDCFGVYCPETDATYWLRIDELPTGKRSVQLRIVPSKNNQLKRIWFAENFTNPLRIADGHSLEKVPTGKRDSSRNTEIACRMVAADLLASGEQVCFPLSAYVPFDLIAIAPDMQTLRRVRVGYRHVEPCAYADQYAIYDPDTHSISYETTLQTA